MQSRADSYDATSYIQITAEICYTQRSDQCDSNQNLPPLVTRLRKPNLPHKCLKQTLASQVAPRQLDAAWLLVLWQVHVANFLVQGQTASANLQILGGMTSQFPTPSTLRQSTASFKPANIDTNGYRRPKLFAPAATWLSGFDQGHDTVFVSEGNATKLISLIFLLSHGLRTHPLETIELWFWSCKDSTWLNLSKWDSRGFCETKSLGCYGCSFLQFNHISCGCLDSTKRCTVRHSESQPLALASSKFIILASRPLSSGADCRPSIRTRMPATKAWVPSRIHWMSCWQ